MTREQRLQAMRAGRYAGLKRLPVTVCPYGQSTPDGRALASAWVREWTRHNPDAAQKIDFTG